MFVPPGVHLQMRKNAADKKVLGSFKGLTTYSSDDKLKDMGEVVIYPDDKDKDATKYVRFCTGI